MAGPSGGGVEYTLCGPRSTSAARRWCHIQQRAERNREGVRERKQFEVGRVPSADFEPADVRPVEPRFTSEVLLGPVLRGTKLPDAFTKPPEHRMRSGTRRHASMLPMVHKKVHRP